MWDLLSLPPKSPTTNLSCHLAGFRPRVDVLVSFLERMFKIAFTTCAFLLPTVSLSCGGTTSENNTYIVQAATTSAPASPCTYKVCPCSSDICRIRYDFTSNQLADQVKATAAAAGGAAADLTSNFRVGDCLTDQMSISAPGGVGSPIICGYNSGQHSKISNIRVDLEKPH